MNTPESVTPKARRPRWHYLIAAVLGLCLCGAVASLAGKPSAPVANTKAVVVETATEAPSATDTVAVALATSTPEAAIVEPTDTAIPAAKTESTPFGCTAGARYGAICKDGSRTDAPSQGACSRHKGVKEWLICP